MVRGTYEVEEFQLLYFSAHENETDCENDFIPCEFEIPDEMYERLRLARHQVKVMNNEVLEYWRKQNA